MGQGHTLETLAKKDWWYLPHQQDCVSRAYRMAGVSPADIDVAQVYDNFSVAVLFWFEHAGFFAPGDRVPSSRAALASPSRVNFRSIPPGETSRSRTCKAGCTSSKGAPDRHAAGVRQVADAEP